MLLFRCHISDSPVLDQHVCIEPLVCKFTITTKVLVHSSLEYPRARRLLCRNYWAKLLQIFIWFGPKTYECTFFLYGVACRSQHKCLYFHRLPLVVCFNLHFLSLILLFSWRFVSEFVAFVFTHTLIPLTIFVAFIFSRRCVYHNICMSCTLPLSLKEEKQPNWKQIIPPFLISWDFT